MSRNIMLIFGLFINLITHAQQYINLSSGTLSQKIESVSPIRNFEQIQDGIIVSYVFNSALLQPDDLYEDAYWWKFEGFGFNENPSEAAVPMRIDQFSIPEGKNASLEIISHEYVDYNYFLAPAREPLPDNTNFGYSKANVLPIKKVNGWFPMATVEDLDIQCYRDLKILNVKVSPIQYDSSRGIVRASKKIVYKVSFTEDKSTGLNEDKHSLSMDDPYIQNITMNGQTQSKTKIVSKSTPNNQDYLIISVPKYESAVNTFAEWKKLLGFNVKVILKDSWTCTSVKSQVQEIYDNDKNLYYLLIVGDHEDIPSNFSSIGPHTHATDLYYGCMDGESDYTPDIYRGRLSVSNLSEANAVINKIINYEKNPITTASFYSQGVNCAYFQDDDKNGYADRRFAQTAEDVRNYLQEQGKTIYRVYTTPSSVNPTNWNNGWYSYGEKIPDELKKPQFAWDGKASDITKIINSGVFYVLHRDHGSITSWSDPYY